MIHPKLWGNYAFAQIFQTRKLDEISVFYTVFIVNFKHIQHSHTKSFNIYLIAGFV